MKPKEKPCDCFYCKAKKVHKKLHEEGFLTKEGLKTLKTHFKNYKCQNKCYDCGIEVELGSNWQKENLTFKDDLEVILCKGCMHKYRR